MAKVKKSETELKQEELEFGIDEAVSVLMTQYSANLQVAIDAASDAVDVIAEEYDGKVKEIKDGLELGQFNYTCEVLGIRSRVRDVDVQVGNTVEDSSVRVVLMLTDLDIVGQNYTPEFGKYRKLEMNGDDFAALTEIGERRNKAIKQLNKLFDKRCDTRTVQQQVRAKVMEVRLKAMGMSDLLDDESVKELITV